MNCVCQLHANRKLSYRRENARRLVFVMEMFIFNVLNFLGTKFQGHPRSSANIKTHWQYTSVVECDRLTLLPPIPLRLYTLQYWSNPPFLITDIGAFWRSVLSARMPQIKNGGLDQYGAGPFEQQQFETAGVEGIKLIILGVLMAGLWMHYVI